MPHEEKPHSKQPSTESSRGGCGAILLGIVLIVAGIPMLVLPGPGIAAILAGLALVAKGVLRPRK